MSNEVKIDKFGFREYDARWVYKKDIDLSGIKPKLLTQDMLDRADKVITMGCNIEDACPANMVITEDWGLDDPKGQSLDKVRSIRNQVKSKVIGLLNEMGHNITVSP